MHGNPEEDNCQNTFLRMCTYLSVFITFVSQDFIPIFDYKKGRFRLISDTGLTDRSTHARTHLHQQF